MKNPPSPLRFRGKVFRAIYAVYGVAALSACITSAGCSTGEFAFDKGSDRSPIAQTPANFEIALKHNQAALSNRSGSPDVALYNIGILLSHPANPKKDQPKAIHSFKTLVAEHPRSAFVEQARTWIYVLEQRQKVTDEKQRLAEERRALSRERETLQQERQKLNYASEKSQQLDLEIERRRRQSLSK